MEAVGWLRAATGCVRAPSAQRHGLAPEESLLQPGPARFTRQRRLYGPNEALLVVHVAPEGINLIPAQDQDAAARQRQSMRLARATPAAS